jgi:hypothetical protein
MSCFNGSQYQEDNDMRNLVLLVIGCLVIAAELEATKKIEEMNLRAQVRAEEMDCTGGKHSEKVAQGVTPH